MKSFIVGKNVIEVELFISMRKCETYWLFKEWIIILSSHLPKKSESIRFLFCVCSPLVNLLSTTTHEHG